LARAVFPPFSLVAFGLAATMQDHAARVETIAADKAADKAQRAKRKADGILAKQQAAQVAEPEPLTQLDTRGKVLAFYSANPYASFTAAGKAAQVSRQRVGQIVKELEIEGAINRNGGIEVTK